MHISYAHDISESSELKSIVQARYEIEEFELVQITNVIPITTKLSGTVKLVNKQLVVEDYFSHIFHFQNVIIR